MCKYNANLHKANPKVRLLGICLTFFFLVAVVAGCTSQSQQSQKTSQQAPAQNFNLKMASHMPQSYSNQKVAEKWAKAVEEQTNGRIKITAYPSESLVSAKDLFDSVSTGRTEISLMAESYISGTLPIVAIWDIPFLVNGTQGAKKALDSGLRDLLQEAYLERNVVVLDWNFYSWVSLGSVKKELRKPQDIKGLRLRVHSDIAQKVVEKLGGAAVWLSSGDIYMALQRNTIDAMWNTHDNMEKRKLYEVAKVFVSEPIVTTGCVLGINKAVWDKISPEDRKLMESLARKIFCEEQIAEVDRIDQESLEKVRQNGVNVIKWTPEEREAWKKAMQPIAIEYYLGKTGDRGKKAIELVQKYGQ